MTKNRKTILSFLLGVVMCLAIAFGFVFTMPQKVAHAQSLSTANWTLAREGDSAFRIQNGETYWTGYTNSVTTASMLDYTEINGKTLSEINAETYGSITVTLQPAGGEIGSFYRVSIDTELAGFTMDDLGTVVIKAGWSHTDASGTYTIDTPLYFAHKQNSNTYSDKWKYVPAENVVNIADSINFTLQTTTGETGTPSKALLFSTNDNTYWTSGAVQPNEGCATFLNLIEINGKSIKQWNKEAHALAESGVIEDITFGSTLDPQKRGGAYAPIYVHNSGYVANYGSFFRAYVPSAYISDFAEVKVNQGYAFLTDDNTLFYVEKDVEFVRSETKWLRVASTVDITDMLTFFNGGSHNATDTYYFYTKGGQQWTAQHGSTGTVAINEWEWKGASGSAQGGAVQMSYIYVNGKSVYDINATDNETYNSAHGNIVNGGKYAPIMGWLSTYNADLNGSVVYVQIPNEYPGNKTSLKIAKGFYVLDTQTNIKYEVTEDLQWDYENGSWVEHTNKIQTTVAHATMFGDASDAFAGIKLADSNYELAPSTYPGGVKTAKEYAQSAAFTNYVLIDDQPLAKPGEAFLNVWGKSGYFTFRPGNNAATKITILAGCQIPTYDTLLNGAKEVYVVTEDITFVKSGDQWVVDEGVNTYDVTFTVDGNVYQTVEGVEENATVSAPTAPTKAPADGYEYTFLYWEMNGAEFDFNTPITDNITLNAVFEKSRITGEFDTSISSVVYARDNANNWMMVTLMNKDYPNAGEVYNVNTTEEQISALNLYDQIIVDGYTLRSRIEQFGNTHEAPKINLWVADCFAFRVSGADGALDGAQKITIRAGAQFPSYAYITEGVEIFYVTTEEMTFVNVGASNGVWERQYTATFKADGVTVATVPYLVSKGFTAPEVPEKEGYKGAWESYTANGNIVVNAVYTEKFIENPTEMTTFRWDGDGASYVTFRLSNGENVAQMCGDNPNVKLSIYNLWETVRVTTQSGAELSLKEVYAGDGGDSWYISFGNAPGLLIKLASDYKKTGSDPIVKIYIPAGTEFPSFAKYGVEAYVTQSSVSAEFTGENVWKMTAEVPEGGFAIPTEFENNYILSDLYNVGFEKTADFQDGIHRWANASGDTNYAYGNVDSTSFTLTFDFAFTGANFYQTFQVNLGAEGSGTLEHFGWRFYLLRGSDASVTPNICVEYFSNTAGIANSDHNIPGSADKVLGNAAFVAGETYRITIGYKLVDAATGTVYVYTAVNNYSREDTYALGGDFVTFAPYLNCLTMGVQTGGTVTVCDPDTDINNVQKKTLTLATNEAQVIMKDSYVLPALNPAANEMAGNVFIGWTTNLETLETLYPAGYNYVITEDVTLYPVWMGFAMQSGAQIRKTAPSGIRFLVDLDRAAYDLGVNGGFILESGIILCPTNYLATKALTHELGADYYTSVVTENWIDGDTYSAAFTNISPAQYTRSFSARGYMLIQYTTGVGYVYTTYNEDNHARSIYQVATMAMQAGEEVAEDVDYVNSVADILIDTNFVASKNPNAMGNYTVASEGTNAKLTVTISGNVKAAVVNGVRIVAGYEAEIVIGNAIYNLSGFKMTANGTAITFALQYNENSDAILKSEHLATINDYLNSDLYTAEHKAYICEVIENSDIINVIKNSASVSEYIGEYNAVIEELASIKTAEELMANDKGVYTLVSPMVTKGVGYTVTWQAVENADYYVITDDNDYREYTVVKANAPLVYEVEVIGAHNVTVTAHSYFKGYNSATGNTVATTEVKPVFSYKAMLSGEYKFNVDQMAEMGIPTAGCSVDKGKDLNSTSDDLYIVYYNVDIGWTPHKAMATDWTSPEYFPAHAQRLKDMGNNVLLLAYDTNAMYKAEHTWTASRLRYVMDTAWSMGMKVLVCDQVLYDLSMSDGSNKGATSKAQVTAAINQSKGFAEYVTHPAFYGFSLDDEPHPGKMNPMNYTVSALDDACEALGVKDVFYLACLFQAQGNNFVDLMLDSQVKSYWQSWLNIDGVDNYLYVDIYTKHAMGQPTDRYNTSFNVVYGSENLGGKYDFYQAITAHTQNNGTLLEQDLYMSMLYAAAHDVAGYSWFCYFPITGEMSGSMVGYDGNGYGNGIGNNASGCYYNAAKTAGYQFEILQGWLDGYDWATRSVSGNLLTTTLTNGDKTATMYVNADVTQMSRTVEVTANGSQCYLIGYGVGTAEMPYQAVSGSVTLQPGQAVICM